MYIPCTTTTDWESYRQTGTAYPATVHSVRIFLSVNSHRKMSFSVMSDVVPWLSSEQDLGRGGVVSCQKYFILAVSDELTY